MDTTEKEINKVIDLLKDDANTFLKKMNKYREQYLNRNLSEIKYSNIIESIDYKFNQKCSDTGAKVGQIFTDQIEKDIDLFYQEHSKRCDNISLMPFKTIKLPELDMIITICPMGSKWTSQLVSEINPLDGSIYNIYLTTIESNYLKDTRSRISHRTLTGGNSHYGIDWIYLKTEHPLIEKELIFASEIGTKEQIDEENFGVTINQRILSFGYMRQEGYSSPVYHLFPKIEFIKNRAEFCNRIKSE